jgi:hypothetical protein
MESSSSFYHMQNTYQIQQSLTQTQPEQVTYQTEYMNYAEPMISEIIIEPNMSNNIAMKTITESPKVNPKPNKQYDGNTIANQFINYYYQSWMVNPTILLTDDVIKTYSKLKYSNQVYEGESFIEVLKGFVSPGLQFTDCNFEILDSGSRQVYILVTGIIKNDLISKNFSQTFMIAYAGENNKKSLRKWTLMNSLFIVK